MKISHILTSLFLVIAQPYPAMAETGTSRSDVMRLLQEIVARTPVRDDLMALGFRGENLELAVAQSKVFVQDPEIAGYLADRIIEANDGKIAVDASAGGLVQPLVNRGLGHLPLREMRYFYLVEQAVINAFSIRDCGLAVKERLSARRQFLAASKIEVRMNTAALREYYRIQLKAARLGVHHPAVRLTEAAKQRIVVKIHADLSQRVADAKDVQGLITAYDNLQRVSNRRACAAGRLFMETILSLQGRDLRDALILLSSP